VGVPLLLYLQVRETPDTRARRRRRQLLPFAVVLAAGAALVVAGRFPDAFHEVLVRLHIAPGDPPGATPPDAEAYTPPAPDWVPLAVLSSMAVSGVAVLAGRRALRRRGRRAQRESVVTALSDALDGSLEDLRREPDGRRAVIAAYARMEAALECCGVPRNGPEAPLEYVGRVLLELDVQAGPVLALTELYERARFSDHALDATAKEEAVAALEDIRADLRRTAP
jgi:hypothetical protein